MSKAFVHSIRVYYKDTDCAGIVYYAKYLEFLEVTRAEFLRSLGISSSEIAKKYEIFFPIANVNINYKKSAVLDDVVEIKSFIETPSPIKIVFKTEMFNPKGELLNDSSVLCVSVGTKSLRPEKMPEELVKIFKTYRAK